jgi:hypothetical protein
MGFPVKVYNNHARENDSIFYSTRGLLSYPPIILDVSTDIKKPFGYKLVITKLETQNIKNQFR